MDELVSQVNEDYVRINERMAVLTGPVMLQEMAENHQAAVGLMTTEMEQEMESLLSTSEGLLATLHAVPDGDLNTENLLETWYAMFENVSMQNMKLRTTIRIYRVYRTVGVAL